MKNWERNHDFDCTEIDAKIESLKLLEIELNAMIREARKTSARVDLESLLKLNVA